MCDWNFLCRNFYLLPLAILLCASESSDIFAAWDSLRQQQDSLLGLLFFNLNKPSFFCLSWNVMCSGMLIIAEICLWACFCTSREFISEPWSALLYSAVVLQPLNRGRRTTPLDLLITISLMQAHIWLAAFLTGAHCWQMFDFFIRTLCPCLQSRFHGLFLSWMQDIVLGSSLVFVLGYSLQMNLDLLFKVSRGMVFFCVIERRSLALECGNRSSQCFACQE